MQSLSTVLDTLSGALAALLALVRRDPPITINADNGSKVTVVMAARNDGEKKPGRRSG
jgi:hypothetical protein